MRISPSRRAGIGLVLLCFGLGAGTLHWTWKRLEPGVRFGRVCSLIRAHRGQKGSAWSEGDRKAFWASVAWLDEQRHHFLWDELYRLLASADPVDRETAAVLACGIFCSFHDRDPAEELPWILPRPDVEPSSRRMQTDGDAISRMATDESRLVRVCFLELMRRAEFRDCAKAMAQVMLHDRDPDLRVQAVLQTRDFFDTREGGAVLLKLADDANPRIRLAAQLQRIGVDPEAFRAVIDLVTDPRQRIPTKERLNVLERVIWSFRALEPRCADTWNALRDSPDQLPAVAEQWKTWLQSTDYEAFAQEVWGD